MMFEPALRVGDFLLELVEVVAVVVVAVVGPTVVGLNYFLGCLLAALVDLAALEAVAVVVAEVVV